MVHPPLLGYRLSITTKLTIAKHIIYEQNRIRIPSKFHYTILDKDTEHFIDLTFNEVVNPESKCVPKCKRFQKSKINVKEHSDSRCFWEKIEQIILGTITNQSSYSSKIFRLTIYCEEEERSKIKYS